jgi:Leucine-rich repeat (LRR) protein
MEIRADQLDSLTEDEELLVVDASISTWPAYFNNFPVKLFNLLNLKKLKVSNMNLTSIPDSIDILYNLEELDFDVNKITTIPESLYNLKNLKVLGLDRNPLKNVPYGISKLSNLQRISLVQCNLDNIPLNILELENLQHLNIWKNNIKILPNDIFIKLKNLKCFLLGNNPIVKIPNGLSLNKNLTQICFANILPNAYPDDFIDYPFAQLVCNFSIWIINSDNLRLICNVKEIENIPPTTINLIMSNIKIDYLNNLPIGLEKLVLKNCQISYLDNLPITLQKLVLVNCQVPDLKIPFGTIVETSHKDFIF